MSKDFGYPSKQPCVVCEQHKNNQSEPRFSYTVCEDHQNIPPAFVHQAASQFQRYGGTEWDK